MEINISKDYTNTPGARFKTDGPFSGEDFREKFLEKLFEDKNDNSTITIIFDGAVGYGTSFLEEAFGGLVMKYGKDRCLSRLKFISREESLLIEEVMQYIEEAEDSHVASISMHLVIYYLSDFRFCLWRIVCKVGYRKRHILQC